MDDRLLRPTQVMQMLNIQRPTLQKLVDNGALMRIKIRGLTESRFLLSQVQALISPEERQRLPLK